jgi:hypothetical protein
MNTIRLSSSRPWISSELLLVWSVTGSGLLTTTAQAEWYVGGYGGFNIPGGLSNAAVSDSTLGGGVTNARIDDLQFKSGLLSSPSSTATPSKCSTGINILVDKYPAVYFKLVVSRGRFPRLYRRGLKLITIFDRPALQDLALTPVFTDGELPLD